MNSRKMFSRPTALYVLALDFPSRKSISILMVPFAISGLVCAVAEKAKHNKIKFFFYCIIF